MHQTIFASKFFDDQVKTYYLTNLRNLDYKKGILNRWITAIRTGTIQNSNETQIDIAFLNDIFGEVLEYEYKVETPLKNLLPKVNVDSTSPDAVLGYFEQQSKNDIRAVIELKDIKKDLDTIQNRLERITPVTQAFEYGRKAGTSCKWIVVSNIHTIRLYNKESDRYELFRLIDLEDDFQLRRFFFLLHNERLFFQKGESPVDTLYRKRTEQEVKISTEFYSKYRSLRFQLFDHIKANNPEIEPLVVLEKTQKLLDRIIFICFCADLSIIPTNVLKEVVSFSQATFLYQSMLWTLLKNLFTTLDLGNNHISKLNGGLFEEDETLNNLVIKDTILTQLLFLSSYDYRSDLNVNILGHIFEQSISDLEGIKTSLKNGEIALLKHEKNGKRKAFGIFYTPEYITKHLVKETIGKWLIDRRLELFELDLPDLTEKDYDLIKITKQGTLRTNPKIELHKKFWNQYLEKFLSLKILDPACGSGAFLVQCFDFMVAEYKIIQKELRLLNPPEPPDEFKPKLKQGITIDFKVNKFDIEEHILKNCLFGVDLNFESVEITKLSLWLKTVKYGKALSNIDYNIQNGNSLIDDFTIAGTNAFKWESRFSNFDKFDVVVGNPPYGVSFTEKEREYISKKFKSFEYQANSYVLFYEKGIDLLKPDGYLGYITPNTFTNQHYFNKLREILNDLQITSVCKQQYAVFDDADIGDTVSFIIKNTKHTAKDDVDVKICRNYSDFQNNDFLKVSFNSFIKTDKTYNLSHSDSFDIEKIYKETTPLGELAQIVVGVKAYQTGKGNPRQTEQIVQDKIFTSSTKIDESYFQCVNGKDFHRYRFLNTPKMFIKYGVWLAEPRFPAPFFDNEKIIVRQTSDELICHIDENKWINLNNVYNIGNCNEKINIRYLLALLNSKLLNYVYQCIAQEKDKLFAEVKKIYLEKLPIKLIETWEQKPYIELVDRLITLNKELFLVTNNFTELLISDLQLPKLSGNLENWYNLSWKELNSELSKQKKNIQLKELTKWKTFYLEQQSFAKDIAGQIDFCVSKLDEMVFQLYNISQSEISIIIEEMGKS